jgi:hypothetical protein
MSYDEILKAAEIGCDGQYCFTYADIRRLIDYFVAEKPEDFEIQRTLILDDYIIRKVAYPNCPKASEVQVHVHPPYWESPVATFQPSEEGWSMAIQFVSRYIS